MRLCALLLLTLLCFCAVPALAQRLPGRDTIPALPPDSTSQAMLEEIFAEENRVYYSEHHRNWYLRNVIRLSFHEDTPQELRQEAVERIGGEVIGGARFVANGGLYLIRIGDDGTAAPLWNAIEQLRALPQVYSAGPFYHFVPRPRSGRLKDERDAQPVPAQAQDSIPAWL